MYFECAEKMKNNFQFKFKLFVSWMYFETGDRGRAGCNELNDYHLKAVSGRPVIMRIF